MKHLILDVLNINFIYGNDVELNSIYFHGVFILKNAYKNHIT